jgi:hypothetical protein
VRSSLTPSKAKVLSAPKIETLQLRSSRSGVECLLSAHLFARIIYPFWYKKGTFFSGRLIVPRLDPATQSIIYNTVSNYITLPFYCWFWKTVPAIGRYVIAKISQCLFWFYVSDRRYQFQSQLKNACSFLCRLDIVMWSYATKLTISQAIVIYQVLGTPILPLHSLGIITSSADVDNNSSTCKYERLAGKKGSWDT